MPSSVRLATRADLPAIAATLAEAFVDDPVKQHLTGVSHVPPSRSLPFFDAFTRMQMPKGHVYVAEVDGDVRGAALWSPPGQWRVPTGSILRWGPRFVRMYGRRFPANLNVLKTVEKHHPHEPHYYLEFLGVHPAGRHGRDDQHHRDGEHQQEVDEASHRVRADHAEQPEHDEQNENRVEHRSLQLGRRVRWSREQTACQPLARGPAGGGQPPAHSGYPSTPARPCRSRWRYRAPSRQRGRSPRPLARR